jgi:hypothetical protein
MSYEYSFVVTKKTDKTVEVYVYKLDNDKIDSFQIDDKAEFINYSVENNDKVQFSVLKEGLDNSTEDKQDMMSTKDTDISYKTANSENLNNNNNIVVAKENNEFSDDDKNIQKDFGGKKRKGRTHKKVKKGGMKTIKIRR